jgi:hypothetical protein
MRMFHEEGRGREAPVRRMENRGIGWLINNARRVRGLNMFAEDINGLEWV